MFTIRPAQLSDLQGIQQVNLTNLPENYTIKFIFYHGVSWPQGSYVATVKHKNREKIVGYVLGKMEDDNKELPADSPPAGHITSVSVMRSYRRMGIAAALLKQCLRDMRESYHAESVSLHVRQSNEAALHLYRDTLQFEVLKVEKGYYADGEDAYSMKKVLPDAAASKPDYNLLVV